MPQIDLFLSEKDLEALTNLILSQGGVLVPDKRYSTPQYSGIADVSTFMEARREAKLFFVLHRSYLVTPLEMRCKQGGDASMCYIMQRNGGPSIDIFCPAQIEAGDRRTIGQGYMGYHPTFWNPLTRQNEKPPVRLKEMYALFVGHIKTHSARLSLAKRTFWIGLDALRLSRLGWTLYGLAPDQLSALSPNQSSSAFAEREGGFRRSRSIHHVREQRASTSGCVVQRQFKLKPWSRSPRAPAHDD